MVELWMIIAIGVGITTAAGFLMRRRKLASQGNVLLTLASTLVVLGIIFGDDRVVGYSFIGVGVSLSIISAVRAKKGMDSWRRKHERQ
jgi:hydrogenase maturation factor